MSRGLAAIRDAKAHAIEDVLEVCLLTPGSQALQGGDLARVFRSRRLTRARRARLTESHLVVVSYRGDVCAIAAYKLVHDNVCAVHELALLPNLLCEPHRVVDVAMDAIETACVANGSDILLVLRTDIARAVFKRRGYAVVFERCAGAWLQKDLSSARAGQFPRRTCP